jgi:hypothetical protein
VAVTDFFTRLNPVFAGILRTPILHWLLSHSTMMLSYEGRRSGRRVSFPVGYRQRGNDIAVLASEARRKSWWRNFRQPGEVDLLLRGRRRRGCAVLVPPDDPFFRESVEEVLRRVPGMKRVFEVAFDRGAGLTPAQIARLGDEIACVRITLEPDA